MTKVKATSKSLPSTPKGNIKNVKDPVIGKNKTPKFKSTPTGKVALINGSTPKSEKKKNTPKGNGNMSQTSPQNGKGKSPQNKQNNSNGKQKSPNNKKNLAVQAQQKSPGNKKNKKTDLSLKDENDSDSDSDINEGISISEEVSGVEDHSDSDVEDEPGLTDILGDSLANESDEDDDDFEDDEDEDEDTEAKNKGVKMFKGLKTKQVSKKADDNDDDDDDEDDEDEEEEEEEEEEEAGLGLKALLGNSLADDDDDDDFDEGDEEDDDEDISDEDEEEEGSVSPAKKQKQSPAAIIKKQKDSSNDEDNDDDDDDDEDEDEDEDEDDGDDDDDEDNENEKTVAPRLTREEMEERKKRSIYIGNVPKETTNKEIKNVFSKYGLIENIRFRSTIPENPKMSHKAAAITKKIHPRVTAVNVFVVYKLEESVQKALEMNGKLFNGNYLRVDQCKPFKLEYDTKKAVFVGNLPFDTNDNMIWTHFADCGKITSVRVVRDKYTGVGRGFGYINFDSADSVTLALKLDGSNLGKRDIRVKLIEKRNWQDNAGKRKFQGKKQYGGSPKKFKNDSGDSNQSSPNEQRKVEKKRSQGEQKRQRTDGGSPRGKGADSFQGQKSDMKKKSQSGQFEKKKKIMAAKLISKPKQPMAN